MVDEDSHANSEDSDPEEIQELREIVIIAMEIFNKKGTRNDTNSLKQNIVDRHEAMDIATDM